jgi:hypothetical protein
MVSIAAHPVKELATQSSLIVIAATRYVREISELFFCTVQVVRTQSVIDGRSPQIEVCATFLLLVPGDDGGQMFGHRRIQRA